MAKAIAQSGKTFLVETKSGKGVVVEGDDVSPEKALEVHAKFFHGYLGDISDEEGAAAAVAAAEAA